MAWAGGVLWRNVILALAPPPSCFVWSRGWKQRLGVQPLAAQLAGPSRCLGTLKISVSPLANWY